MEQPRIGQGSLGLIPDLVEQIEAMARMLDEQDVPKAGRHVVASPHLSKSLLKAMVGNINRVKHSTRVAKDDFFVIHREKK